jgi:hypothetical protein
MSEAQLRQHLRRELGAHLTRLGYSAARLKRPGLPDPEIARVSPVRGTVVYGETVLATDLRNPQCHERLLFLSQRRTRRRSSIPLFIGVPEEHRADLDALLERLGIRTSVRGAHIQVVAIASPTRTTVSRRSTAARAARG